jgi:hypothetical protein
MSLLLDSSLTHKTESAKETPILYGGITVGRDELDVVLLSVSGADAQLVAAVTFRLQIGDRPTAYNVMLGQFSDFLKNQNVHTACIKGSAVNRGGTTMAHLEAAELRGVVTAATTAAGCKVRIISAAIASRSFGERKLAQYLADDAFWANRGLSNLQKGKREAAFVVLYEVGRGLETK